MYDSLQKILFACLENASNATALFDPADQLHFANQAFIELYQAPLAAGADFAGIMRACYLSRRGLLIETDDMDAWLAGVTQRRRRSASRSYEADFSDGRWLWVTETTLPDGWLYYNGTDITALKNKQYDLLRAHDSAVLAAHTDPLTGLGNRRAMTQAMQRQLASGGGAACIIDLDHFKRINDGYGHPAGDEVLRHFADTARGQCRPGDLLTRIGGEEFLLLLPSASLAQADQVLRRLREHLRRSAMLPVMPALRYTFSAGVTSIMPGDSVDGILLRADKALYAAKQGGRDRHELLDCALRGAAGTKLAPMLDASSFG